jgi:CRP/FNR family transcriptional regulator, cyclic AMP receptor protein
VFARKFLKNCLVIVTESAQALAVLQKETKMRTASACPRNNAFGLRFSGKTGYTSETGADTGRLKRRPGYLRPPSESPADLLTKLFARAKLVRLAAGDILFRAGASGDDCYRVEDGLLKVMMVSSSGAERILAFVGPGAIVGELSIIDGVPRSATVMAVRDAKLCSLSRAGFEAFAEQHPEVYRSFVKFLAQRLRETDTLVAASSFLSLKGRVAHIMLALAQHFGQEVAPGRILIRQKIGQNDLAAMAGIARENLTRVLNDWQRRKLVSRLSGYYCLENKALLEHQAKL